jgi:outer membrane receptor protein involved in Fe transport
LQFRQNGSGSATIRDPQVRPSFYQDLSPVVPQVQQPLTATPPSSPARRSTTSRLFAGAAPRSNLILIGGRRGRRTATDVVLGIEAAPRVASDVGSLLGKVSNGRGLTAQKRSPIITDPRVRGSRVGQLSASGSHWVPARIDLDTMVSKLDSRIIDDVTVIKGPYASRYGPGFAFLDIELLKSPRSRSVPEYRGATSLEYQTNGEQWYGRQSAAVAAPDWGIRFGYGHRTGSDYESGDGFEIPASYKSRDFDLTVGRDFGDGQNLEVYLLRQDQTDVELAGQAFDLDASVTNAFGATWTSETVPWADRLEVESWYNETHLKGNAQSASKRRTFPFLNKFNYVGLTKVDSLSTGARLESSWEVSPDRTLAAGVDLRVIRQQLDEFSSGVIPGLNGFNFSNRNSPIPKSASANPGVYLELAIDPSPRLRLSSGVRVDVVTTEMLASARQISDLGIDPISLAGILGTDDFDQSYGLWSAYFSGGYDVAPEWTLHFAAGHGQRAPSLTELYAAETFMFLLQNGLNTVTGDPLLDPERQTQIDLGVSFQGDHLNFRLNGFYAWVHDRITFERFGSACDPRNTLQQIHLKYVNTDLATLIGFDANLEYELTPDFVAFSTIGFVEGTDQTRNGDFATIQRSVATSSTRFVGKPRGASQNGLAPGALGAAIPSFPCVDNHFTGDVPQEPLPGIPPLEARAGFRVSGRVRQTQATIELSVRAVDSQHRVASTLFETPTPGFVTCDLRSVWQLNQNMTVVAGVENLTNEDYREHFDFRSAAGQSVRRPGINFYFGSQLTY